MLLYVLSSSHSIQPVLQLFMLLKAV